VHSGPTAAHQGHDLLARRPRLALGGRLIHVQQRSRPDAPLAFDAQDRTAYLECLFDAALGLGLSIHAWSVTGQEANWLVTPQRATALAEAVQQIGRRYVRMLNDRWARRASPFDGRYRAYWLSEPSHALWVMRWIDHRAVREGLVGQPSDWPWSSAGVLQGHRAVPPRVPFVALPSYWALGNTPFEREQAYAHLEWQGRDFSDALSLGLSQGRPMLTEQEWAALPEADRLVWQRRPRGRPRKS
jgi:putative transposase